MNFNYLIKIKICIKISRSVILSVHFYCTSSSCCYRGIGRLNTYYIWLEFSNFSFHDDFPGKYPIEDNGNEVAIFGI